MYNNNATNSWALVRLILRVFFKIKILTKQGCRFLLSIGGENLQFYPNFALFEHWGMNHDHDFVQVSKSSEDQKKGLHQKRNSFFPKFNWRPKKRKKKVFTKNGTLLFPKFKWTPTLRGTPESNHWEDADVDHTQTIGGDTAKLLGEIIPPPPPPGFGIPVT